MKFYEVLIADSKYRSDSPLTYMSDGSIQPSTVVSVPLKQSLVTGFILKEVPRPSFEVKSIKSVLSNKALPKHCLLLAEWLREYYCCSMGEALRQFAPSVVSIRRQESVNLQGAIQEDLDLDVALTTEQQAAIKRISACKNTTVLLHGDTGSGKTRVYLELALDELKKGRSVFILTPEIALTSQLEIAATAKLSSKVYVLHSELTPAKRKRMWFEILESDDPVVVIGPRSALFAPVSKVGLVVVDEAHEPAYKQEQSPRYHAVRVASQLGHLTGAKVVLGSATPTATDYFLASSRESLVRMRLQAKNSRLADVDTRIIDLRDKKLFPKNQYLSQPLINTVNSVLSEGKQAMIYFNRRGSARLLLCSQCGWQMLCPRCDVPLIYHGDIHQARCHICDYRQRPPSLCPECSNHDIIYASIGTKTLAEMVAAAFPHAKVKRFDSDNIKGERLNDVFTSVTSGDVDIIVGTQLIAKGLDLPKLGLVGIISAETSLTMPDYTAEERTFQLLYQVIGRVGRHGKGKVVLQSYDPNSFVIQTATTRDYESFYNKLIEERRNFRFPPFSFLLKLTCKRATQNGAEKAANTLKSDLLRAGLPVEILGPSASFYARRGDNYYYQIVVKAKQRQHLIDLARIAPTGWSIDLDPIDLL